MAGDLIQSFRQTVAKIKDIERRIAADRVELAALCGEVEELRAALRVDAAASGDQTPAIAPTPRKRPIRDKSSVGWAKRVLAMSGGPMYVDDIIRNIEHMTGRSVSKATLVSNLSRYVKARDTFRRVAANTFELISDDAPESEIRLVG